MTDNRAKRALPLLPHPDHLRKQAKARLARMRQTAPATRLAEAQALLAREYGFSDWPALQAEIARRTAHGPRSQEASLRQADLTLRPANRFQAAPDADSGIHTPADFLRFGMISQTVGFILAISIAVIILFVAQGRHGIITAAWQTGSSLRHWAGTVL